MRYFVSNIFFRKELAKTRKYYEKIHQHYLINRYCSVVI